MNPGKVLTEVEVLANDLIGDSQPVVLQNASATHQQKGLGAALVLDGVKLGAVKGWAIHPRIGKESLLVIETKKIIAAQLHVCTRIHVASANMDYLHFDSTKYDCK